MDLAKCSAILFMILVHVFWKLGSEFEDPIGYTVNYILGAFMAAPVFMVAMGIGFVYTRRNEPRQFIQRGVNLLIIGYLLNLVRVLPVAVYNIASDGYAASATELWSGIFQGDILQFAGLSMIFFGLLKKARLSSGGILILSCITSLSSYLIPAVMSDCIPLNATAGLFLFIDFPEETIMCFPLFSWFIFPAFGNYFAEKLQKMKDPKRFFRIALLPCLLVAAAGSCLEMSNRVFMMKSNSEYYHMFAHDAAISLCYVVFCFALCYFICQRLSEKANHAVAVCSDALNLIYLIHWPIVYWIGLIFVEFCDIGFTNLLGFLTVIPVAAVSIFLGILSKQKIKKHLMEEPKSVLRYIQ